MSRRGRCGSRHVPAKETDRNMPVPVDLGLLWAREFSPKWTDRGMRGALTEKDPKKSCSPWRGGLTCANSGTHAPTMTD